MQANGSDVGKFLSRKMVEHIRTIVNEKFPEPQAHEKFLRVFEEVLHGAAGDDGVTWWRKMGKLKEAITTSIGELLQLVYMLTACGAPGQLWHVDQNPITTTRRNVGLGILALGVAVHIDVVDGSHKWEYEEREGTFHPTNAPAGTRWRRVHIPQGHVFLAHSHLVHAGAPGRGGGDPLRFNPDSARVHFLFGREGNQEEGGTYPVEYRGEEKEQSTRDEARDDSSTGAPCDAPRDATALPDSGFHCPV